MKIINKQISNNRTRVWERKIKYIVIHDTGNVRNGANAEMHWKYFEKKYRGASADFFVDDKEIYQINDFTMYKTWHVGDGKNKYGINNSNSIAIELCVNSDADPEKAYQNLVTLTKYLIEFLNIPAENVVRHYDASRKNCPSSMAKNDWEKWKKFKEDLAEIKEKKIETVEEALQYLTEIKVINSPRYWLKVSAVIKYFDIFLINIANRLH